MRVYYSRVSTVEQSTDRQLHSVTSSDYDLILIDKCSGSIPLFDRPQGSQIKRLIEAEQLTLLEVHSIDRLGRNTLDILNVFRLLTDLNIRLICRNPAIQNFTPDGKIDMVAQMIVSMLSVLSEYEKSLIRERQLFGIMQRKNQGLYQGRRVNTQESTEKFLNKKKSKQILEYLALGYSQYEIKQILGCSYSTISKVKRLNQEQESQKAD